MSMNTLAEVRTSSDGQVTLTVLGPTEGKEGRFTGQFAENKLTLQGNLVPGVSAVTMSLIGDKLAGSVESNSGTINISAQRTTGPKDISSSGLMQAVWQSINDHFFDPRFNGVDWKAVKARYLRQAKTARTAGEFVTLVRKMLGELKVSHLDFFLAPEKPPLTYTARTVTWRQLSPQVGYLRIRDFENVDRNGPAVVIPSLERAMSELNGMPSLIVDLRGNGGGSQEVTLQALNYFLADQKIVLYAATRAGLTRNKANSLEQISFSALPIAKVSDGSVGEATFRHGAVAIVAGGASHDVYRGRIGVLIDEHCHSSCELFAAILKESRSAVLVGRKTSGAVLGANVISYSNNKAPTPWRLKMPVIDMRTAGKLRLEGNGVNPDVVVVPNTSEDGEDADLSRAMMILSASHSAASSRPSPSTSLGQVP